jgi:Carboxypeptidase regulatory-like domain
MQRMLRRWLVLSAVMVMTSIAQWGLAQSGTITGTVRDPEDAVLTGASISITNVDNDFERTFSTDEHGDYTVPFLPPGTYRIEVTLAGFRTQVAENIILSVDDRLRIDLVLQIGAVSERVTVTESTPVVQSESSSVGVVIDNQKIVELSLNGRQFESLAQLVPGSLAPAPGSVLSFRGGFNAAGARETANSNILDGVDNNDPAINNFTLRPILDAIQEFKVLANSYSAEFGRGGGAQVIVSTKSGTNDFHLSAWEFLRNDKLDARDFFNKKESGPKPPFHRNQFGATAGGPITPKRTFFFAAYEGVRRRQVFTSRQQVPTTAFLNGDFSSVPTPVRDPENRVGPTFPGNLIPAARINPVAKKILERGSFPLPTPGLAAPNNYLAVNPFPNDVNQFNGRLDHNLNHTTSLFARYGFTKDVLITPCADQAAFERFSVVGSYLTAGNSQTSCVPGFGHNDTTKAQSLSLGATHVFSPQMIMDVRAGFNRQVQSRIAFDSGKENISSELGIPASSDPKDFGHPIIAITGFSTIGDRGYQKRAGTTGQISGSLSYTASSHSLRIGADVRRILFFAGSNVRETIRFSGFWTGNPFADFLLGFPSQTTRDPADSFRYHITNSYNWFIQDDYRVSNRLTVNFGLRYEYNSPDTEKQNRMGQLNIDTLTYEIAGVNGASRALYSPDKNNFGPRFGFALRPERNGKSVFRGGYGIFYDLAVVGNDLFFVRNGPPFQQPETFDTGTLPGDLTLSDPYRSSRVTTQTYDAPSIDPHFRNAYIQQWNLGYQRELPSNILFEVTYVGNKGTKLVKTVDVNQAFPVAGFSQPPLQPRRPLPAYGAIPLLESSGSSIYHGLLGRLERRFSAGLSFLASYTFGHASDDSTGGNVTQDARNLHADRGNSDFDARHRMAISYVYELPFGRGRAFGKNWGRALNSVLGGWEFSGIGTFQSGQPIFVQLSPSDQNSNTGSTRDRPDITHVFDGQQFIVTTVKPVIENSSDKTLYLDPGAFTVPVRGTFGTLPRNVFNGPGTRNWDFMLGKNFRTERVNVQFRTEMYNALNHPSLGQPNRFVDTKSFGTITTTLLQNRQIQFGLKLTY